MDLLPPAHEIAMIVAKELPAAGVPEVSLGSDERHLFFRAILPMTCTPRPRDVVHGGVAVRTAGRDIHVRHYTFRQVCSNGAIMSTTIFAQNIRRVTFAATTDQINAVVAKLRQAVRACTSRGTFANVSSQLRWATQQDAGPSDDWLRQLPHGSGGILDMLRRRIDLEFGRAYDPSLYGALNAVTAAARKVSNQELRWRLEQLGGRHSASPRAIDRLSPTGEGPHLCIFLARENFRGRRTVCTWQGAVSREGEIDLCTLRLHQKCRGPTLASSESI